MHPTDELLALSHARIAKAAAAGLSKGTQPTLKTDAQHIARLERFERRDVQIFRQNGTVDHIRTLSQADAALAYALDADL